MSATATQTASADTSHSHRAFFRQSGWLMTANVVAGVLSWAVHFLNKKIPDAEYSNFGTLLMVTACVPTLPLQMVFAHQAAQALALHRERQLAGMVRLTVFWLALLWLAIALGVLALQSAIVTRWQVPLAGLWITMFSVLIGLLAPMFVGLQQGKQDFLGMGWGMILGGFGRIAAAAILVLGFACGASGMIAGALIGGTVMAGIAFWRTRDLWAHRPEPFDARASLGQIVPLMLGFGACQFLFTADTVFAKAFFSGEEMKPYVAAGTLSRALLWAVLPLAAVMFPKLVRGHARAEKTSLLGIVALGTGALTVCGMLALWLAGPWVVAFVYKSGDVAGVMRLLPWYAGAMIPLALANVFVNDLLARNRFGIVVPALLLAVAYGVTLVQVLHRFPGRLEVVLQTLGAFNLLLLLVSAGLARFGRALPDVRPKEPPAPIPSPPI